MLDFSRLYARFDAPVTCGDCGKHCAPFNPSGKPFCCDIVHAVPAVYRQEWDFLRRRTNLWHEWNGPAEDEAGSAAELHASMPEHMLLLECTGPDTCQRPYRAVSCRQFPFFPYITSDLRFIGLAYDWEFENQCWVISHLEQVSGAFRQEFVGAFDEIFAAWEGEIEGYSYQSEDLREFFLHKKRRIPLLHRNGKNYLVSPLSERMQLMPAGWRRAFGPYRTAGEGPSSP